MLPPIDSRMLPSGCDVILLDTASINCTGWVPGCSGGLSGFTFSVMKSGREENSTQITLQTRQGDGFGNTKNPLEVRVGSSTDYTVRICSSLGACNAATKVGVVGCAAATQEKSAELVENAFALSEQCLLSQNAECAQEVQHSLVEYSPECGVGDNEMIIHALEEQAIELFNIYVNAQGNVSMISTDLSSLLDLFAGIAEKSCDGSLDLFDILLRLCMADDFAPDLAAVALNNLYKKLLQQTNGTALVDSALDIGVCLQQSRRDEDTICGEIDVVRYEGEAVTYYAKNIPLSDLDGPNRTEVATPNISLSLPPYFLQQIKLNLNGTGISEEKLVTMACISVHIVSTRVIDRCIGGLCNEGSSLGSESLSAVEFYIEQREPIRLHLTHVNDVQLILLQRPVPANLARVAKDPQIEDLEFDRVQMAAQPDIEQEGRGEYIPDKAEHRFALTEDKDEDVSLCAYYVGDGVFTRDCTYLYSQVIVEGTLIYCDCPHFSSFGILFDAGEGSEEWTVFRIASLSLLAVMWVFLAVFVTAVTFSSWFRVTFGFETEVARNSRVLGEEQSVYSEGGD